MKTLLIIAITLMGTGCTTTFFPTQTEAELRAHDEFMDENFPQTVEIIEVTF
jgi:hypothetical protein